MEVVVKRGLACSVMLLAASLGAAGGPACAAGSGEAREKAAVRSIFKLLLAEISPGDGWTYDLPCVFSETWDEPEPPRRKPLLSVREALDPDNRHPEQICDFAERNKAARAMAKSLAGRAKPYLDTANTSFSYPVFNKSLSRATIMKEGGNDRWTPEGAGDFVGSGTRIFLEKKHGKWVIKRMVNEWTMN